MPHPTSLPVLLLALAAGAAGAAPDPDPAGPGRALAFAPVAMTADFPTTRREPLADVLMAASPRLVVPAAEVVGTDSDPGCDRACLGRHALLKGARYLVETTLTGDPTGQARLELVLFDLPGMAERAREGQDLDLTPTRVVNGREETPEEFEKAAQSPLARAALEAAGRLFARLPPLPSPCGGVAPGGSWLEADESVPSGIELCGAVDTFYETKGPFAGTYALDEVTAVRLVPTLPGEVRAHVRYRYRHLDPALGVEIPVGHDQRTFDLARTGDGWAVTRVGAYLSGEP